MFKSYLKSAVRSLLKNKVPSVINIVGLSIALASSVVVYLFLQVYYTLDTGHEHGDRIALVEHVVLRDEAEQTWGTAPLPLGPALEADLPQVERSARLVWERGDVRTDEYAFTERIGFADPSFFDVFTFPLQAGTPNALATRDQVILSDEAARKYFRDDDPLGRSLAITVGEAAPDVYTVGGVAAPFPNNASLRFDVLLSFDAQLPDLLAHADDWATPTGATFLLLRSAADFDGLAAQTVPYLDRQRVAGEDWPIERFTFERLTDPAPGAHHVLRRPTEAPHPALSMIMVALAGFMMALSCFNYINIALGSAVWRLKEIGVRKVVGGTKRQLIAQFMVENLLLCALALVLGLVLAWGVLVPLFNQVFVMQVELAFTENLGLWGFLVALLAFVGVAAGAYPAFYVTSFQPVRILRGRLDLSSRRWFSHTLTTAQFVIAFLAVIMTAFLTLNGRYLLDQSWGYDPDDTFVVRLSDPEQFDLLRDAAMSQATVLSVAGSKDHVGSARSRVTYTLNADEATEYEADAYTVGPTYADALGLRLHSGRFFDPARTSDDAEAVVITQHFADMRDWTEPLGQTLRLDETLYTVVGVVEDFLHDPIQRAQPTIFLRADTGYRFLTVHAAPGSADAARAALEAAWTRQVPNLPFDAFAQREVFDLQYGSYLNLSRSIGYLAALALLIACMGLFGLASQNIARRLKEVSVRKVLGASVPHIVFLVNRTILVMLTVAAGIATAVTYSGLRVLIGLDVANVMPLTPIPFVLAYALVLLTVAVSVASQSRTLALANPADVLRRG